MKLIIHRGVHTKKAEENKMLAFQKVITNKNYQGLETDIRQTKDKIFVLYHDPLYKGKLINQTLYKEMQKDNIPKLIDLLQVETDKILLLEIKDFDLNIDKLIKLLDKYKRNIYLMSFNNKVIEKIYQKHTRYKLGILNYILNTPDNYHYDFVCILNDILNPFIIDAYRKLKVEVFSYGIRNKKKMLYNVNYIVENKIL